MPPIREDEFQFGYTKLMEETFQDVIKTEEKELKQTIPGGVLGVIYDKILNGN